jgi:hypothetical protein
MIPLDLFLRDGRGEIGGRGADPAQDNGSQSLNGVKVSTGGL